MERLEIAFELLVFASELATQGRDCGPCMALANRACGIAFGIIEEHLGIPSAEPVEPKEDEE